MRRIESVPITSLKIVPCPPFHGIKSPRLCERVRNATVRMNASKLKFAVFAYLAGMVAIHAAMFWNVRGSIRKGYSDFSIYYCAGTMLRQGLGHQLYDDSAQFKIQREFSPQVAIRFGALPYNHPPFEAALFVPLTYVPYPVAFALWDLVNMAMLVALPFLLRPYLGHLQNCSWPLWVLASLGFFPIFIALLQGQDAILLLCLYVLAFVCLKQNRDIFAGGWLALGLFKPHVVLPFVLLLLVQGRKKILYGFLPAAAVLALVSVAIVGRETILHYPEYVLHLENTMARGAIVPSNMPNLRGVLNLIPGGNHGVGMLGPVLSMSVFLFAAWQCRVAPSKDLFNLKFCLAMVASILVSYHLLSYDLSMLMLPLLLLSNELVIQRNLRTWPRALIITSVSILLFSPGLILLMRNNRLAVAGLAVLLLLGGIAGQISLLAQGTREAV